MEEHERIQQLNNFQVVALHISLSHLFQYSISPGSLQFQLCLLNVQALIGKCWKMPCARRLSGRRSSRPARTKHWGTRNVKSDEQKVLQQSKHMQNVPSASPKIYQSQFFLNLQLQQLTLTDLVSSDKNVALKVFAVSHPDSFLSLSVF